MSDHSISTELAPRARADDLRDPLAERSTSLARYRRQIAAYLRGLCAYVAGAVASVALLMRGDLVLDYPYSFWTSPSESVASADATATFAIICMVALGLDLCACAVAMRRVGLFDGLIAPYNALGIYLLPQVALYPPFLAAAVALGIGITVWEHSGGRTPAPLFMRALNAISNMAYASFLIVAIGATGILPMATSSPSAYAHTTDDVAILRDLLSRESLANASYQEIADMLQAVVHIESERLGLQDHEPRVQAGYVGSARAAYNPRTNTIRFSASELHAKNGLSGSDAVECVAHEMAHAYQNAVVDGLVRGARRSPLGTLTPEVTERWNRELHSKVDANRDFYAYYYQDIEMRARDYADDEVWALALMAYGDKW